MWIFHPLGFASIVKPDHGRKLLARSRFEGDLEALFPGCEVTVTPQRDYLFRAFVTRRQVKKRLRELVGQIGYSNFKDSCPKDRCYPYNEVWWALFDEQRHRYGPHATIHPSTVWPDHFKGVA